MKQLVGWLSLSLMAALSLTGCNDSLDNAKGDTGTLSLPLVTHGPSGTTYRLENATFEIVPQQYYYDDYPGTGGAGFIAGGTYAPAPTTTVSTTPFPSTSPPSPVIVVTSNDNEETLQVDLEEGNYMVRLVPGWQLNKLEDDTSTPVEAQLIRGETQWTWISPRSTSYIEYEFGLGERSLWFNGKLNINVIVHESPDDVYGGVGGSTGYYPGTVGTRPIPSGTSYTGVGSSSSGGAAGMAP